MKALHIINSLYTGGAEKLIVDSVPLYQLKNLEVDVLCLSKKSSQFKEVLERKSSGSIYGLTDSSVYNPLLVFKIIPYLKKYDIIHIHLFPTLYWVVFAKLLSFSKAQFIYTEHSTSNRRRGNLFFKLVDQFVYNQLDLIVCITRGVKESLRIHLNTKVQIKVLNNGVDIQNFKSINTAKDYSFFEKNDFKIIQISSFSRQKDQATLIRSLILLPKTVKLILVGDGLLIEEHKNLVQSLKLLDRVKFLGNRYDIPELINYIDVVVLSSYSEGFGLAAVEGMASNRPVIATDIEGVKEVVRDYGLLFQQGDEKQLADLIINLKCDKKYYNQVAKRCLHRSKKYDIRIMVDEYIKLYLLLLRLSP